MTSEPPLGPGRAGRRCGSFEDKLTRVWKCDQSAIDGQLSDACGHADCDPEIGVAVLSVAEDYFEAVFDLNADWQKFVRVDAVARFLVNLDTGMRDSQIMFGLYTGVRWHVSRENMNTGALDDSGGPS